MGMLIDLLEKQGLEAVMRAASTETRRDAVKQETIAAERSEQHMEIRLHGKEQAKAVASGAIKQKVESIAEAQKL